MQAAGHAPPKRADCKGRSNLRVKSKCPLAWHSVLAMAAGWALLGAAGELPPPPVPSQPVYHESANHSPADLAAPDLQRFPGLAQALTQLQTFTLQAGIRMNGPWPCPPCWGCFLMLALREPSQSSHVTGRRAVRARAKQRTLCRPQLQRDGAPLCCAVLCCAAGGRPVPARGVVAPGGERGGHAGGQLLVGVGGLGRLWRAHRQVCGQLARTALACTSGRVCSDGLLRRSTPLAMPLASLASG